MNNQNQNGGFQLPKGYGQLRQVYEIATPGVKGTLFVHEHDKDPKNSVASLKITVGEQNITFRHLWAPKKEHTSKKGSKLLFHNVPNQQQNETWDSPSFKQRRVEVYEGKNGVFAMTAFGILNLRLVERAQASAFNVTAFTQAATTMKEAAQNARTAPPAPASSAPSSPVMDLIRNAGPSGIKLAALKDQTGLTEDQIVDEAGSLMDQGLVYEPTLGTFATTAVVTAR